MTQPSSVTKTFDTSLVDVQRSFSSTETNTSGSSAKDDQPTNVPKPRESSPYRTVPTHVLYSQWAGTYDTDGNVLQAMDDIQMTSLLPEFARLTITNHGANGSSSSGLKLLDLGCGTGRNTVKSLQYPWDLEVEIEGWDSSQAMLDLAKPKCEAVKSANSKLSLSQVDLESIGNVPDHYAESFDGLISTLVLEHLQADVFFAIIAKVLKPGCYALVTNMHEDMGKLSRAGYKTETGERFKAVSYAHSVEGTIEAAVKAGLEVVDQAKEVAVDERLIDGDVINGVTIEKGQVAERARKWIGTKIWYGMILRKR